jgi:ABC-type amino acid transport substrate-binding protein
MATRASTKQFNHLDEAIQDLLDGNIAAVVADKPLLEYTTFSRSDVPLEVVGNTFHPDKYGFAFGLDSPLTKPASVALIRLEESGVIEELEEKYFGRRR